MSIRKKAIIFVLSLNILTILVVFLIAQKFVLDNFNKLENNKAVLSTDRVENIFDSQAEALSVLAADWSNWDDTYDFIVSKSDKYVETNLTDQTFDGAGINLLMMFDSSGNVVYATMYDLVTHQKLALPDSLASNFSPASILIQQPQSGTPVTGVLLLPQGSPLVVTSHAILTSDKTGPSRGTLVMGYYLTPQVIDKISSISKINVGMYSTMSKALELQAILPQVISANGSLIKFDNTQTMSSYKLINDVYDKPAILLKVSMPREFYAEGRRVLMFLVLSLIVIGITSVILGILLVNMLVQKPLNELISDIKKVGTGMNLSLRLRPASTPEFQVLTTNINRMLDSLESSENILKEVNSVLGQKANELEKKTQELENMNKFMIGREVRMAEIKRENEELRRMSEMKETK